VGFAHLDVCTVQMGLLISVVLWMKIDTHQPFAITDLCNNGPEPDRYMKIVNIVSSLIFHNVKWKKSNILLLLSQKICTCGQECIKATITQSWQASD